MIGLGMLIAYDGAGEVIATIDFMVRCDPLTGAPRGLVDFTAREEAGRPHAELWMVDTHDPGHPIKGSKAWPEWLGGRAHEFRVELEGPPGAKRIAALIHKTSGERRERAAIEAAIIERRASTPPGKPVDLRDLVGGPDRPLALDERGRSSRRGKATGSQP